MKKLLTTDLTALVRRKHGFAGVLALVGMAGLMVLVAPYRGLVLPHLNLPGLALVLIGTLLATCISYSVGEVKRMAGRLRPGTWRGDDAAQALDDLTAMARLWTHAEVRKMEDALPGIAHPVLRTGVQLLVNQTPVREALELLDGRVASLHARGMDAVQMLRAMAGFALSFGVLGAVLGIVAMMSQITASDPAVIGPPLATALMSACYGLACAALVFRPLALRLERRLAQQWATMQWVVQGVAMLYDRRGPAALRTALQTLLDADDASTQQRLVSRADVNHPRSGKPRAGKVIVRNARPFRLLHGSHATPF